METNVHDIKSIKVTDIEELSMGSFVRHIVIHTNKDKVQLTLYSADKKSLALMADVSWTNALTA